MSSFKRKWLLWYINHVLICVSIFLNKAYHTHSHDATTRSLSASCYIIWSTDEIFLIFIWFCHKYPNGIGWWVLWFAQCIHPIVLHCLHLETMNYCYDELLSHWPNHLYLNSITNNGINQHVHDTLLLSIDFHVLAYVRICTLRTM